MMFSNMVVSRAALFLVCLAFLFVCIGSLPPERVRLKRALSDDDIIRGLKMYESQMSRMKNKIAAQLAVMDKQRRRIRDIKYYLKRKGDDFDKEDLQGEIVFQTSNILEKLQLASLENLMRETDHHEKGQKDLLRALERENEIMSDIRLRVLDNRLICRDTETEWDGKASAMIKDLAKHYVQCKPNELLQRFYMARKSPPANSKMRYKYRCCRFSMKEKWVRPDDM